VATWQRLSAAANPKCQADAGQWATIRYALDSNGRTVRLCAITLVAGVPPAVITLLLGLHHQPEVKHSRRSCGVIYRVDDKARVW